jgi:hypothetical protein
MFLEQHKIHGSPAVVDLHCIPAAKTDRRAASTLEMGKAPESAYFAVWPGARLTYPPQFSAPKVDGCNAELEVAFAENL